MWGRISYLVGHNWLETATEVLEFIAPLVNLHPLPVILDLRKDSIWAFLEGVLN